MRTSKIAPSLAIFLGTFHSIVLSQQPTNECSIFLQKPVFTATTTSATTKSKEDFRLLQCSAQWKSASEAQSAGVDVTISVYDIPVPIAANWDQSKVEEWKSKNCSQAERNYNFATTFYQTIYAIDPISAKAGLACMQSRFAAEQPKALRCTLTETNNVLLFQAEWRRTPGEPTKSAPQVKSFSVVNTTCQNSSDLAPNKPVLEGGVSLLCLVQNQAAAFSLNTNRGQCVSSATPRLPKVILPMNMVLDKPLFIAGTDVEIPLGARITTNGYPLTINTDRLTIGGQSSIASFVSGSMTPQAPGRYAGIISLTAREVNGKGLVILNAGEAGGNGIQGAGGPPGIPGAPGSTRLPRFQQSCGGGILDWLCQSIPAGCNGGEDGKPGGQGVQGYPGNPGAPGGGAGEVRLDVPIDVRDAFQVLVDVDLAGQPKQCGGQICGGAGGNGGQGGSGGIGGTGGPGAHGTMHCGGTSDGSNGPKGSPGPQGLRGRDGSNAAARFL